MKNKLMKFFLFSVLLTLCWQLAPAQTPDPVDSTKVTMGVVYNDVKDALSQLGAAMKVGAEHVYTILVKQQVVNAITYAAVDLFVLSIGIMAIIMGYRCKDKDGDWPSDDEQAYWFIPGFIILAIGIIATVLTMDWIVMGIVNPEYGAIQEIMNMIKHH